MGHELGAQALDGDRAVNDLTAGKILESFLKINRTVLDALLEADLVCFAAKDINAGKAGYGIRYRMINDVTIAVGFDGSVERDVDPAKPDQGITARLTESVAVLTDRTDRNNISPKNPPLCYAVFLKP